MRKIVSVVMILTMLAMGGMTVFAGEPQLDSPVDEVEVEEYQNVEQARCSLSISGGTAKSSLSVSGKSTTTKISATLYLQKYNSSKGKWTSVTSWSIPEKSGRLSAAKSKSVLKGKYRAKATIKANGESITVYSAIKTY